MTTQLTAHDVTYDRVAQMIDHSLLRPELTIDEVL
ncbi:MAG TPA: deoxyribose-phosphate aldolase, partial [Actinobacteria bacterium]|nr:deoxyribose-phosphate aldolase [Actinomycetota bacterium]